MGFLLACAVQYLFVYAYCDGPCIKEVSDETKLVGKQEQDLDCCNDLLGGIFTTFLLVIFVLCTFTWIPYF
jgi:hypothetical protein